MFQSFFLIRPTGDFSLTCYIVVSLSRGKWYLQTIHGLRFNLFGERGLPQNDSARNQYFFFWFFQRWKID